jgi:hypothetical protein
VIGNEAERKGADVGGLRVDGEPAPDVEVLALPGVARAGSEQRVRSASAFRPRIPAMRASK